MTELHRQSAGYSLLVYPDKTKIFTHADRRQHNKLEMETNFVEIRKTDTATTYRGRQLSINKFDEAEMEHRMKSPWACYSSHKIN